MHAPTMPLREFDDAQKRMPTPLAGRTQRLRACATRAPMCACCGVARRLLWLCFAAVRHGDDQIAAMLLGEAEHYVDTGGHHPNCPHPPPRPPRTVRRPAQGRVPGWSGAAGRPLVAATDASWKRGTCGLGYVVDDGRWGMRGWTFGPQDPTGPSRVLVSELRAVALLLDRVGDGPELTLLVDSLTALRFLRAWRRGDTGLLPDGYELRPRRSGPPSLVRLATRVAGRPNLRFAHVKAHSGHPLNETADSLASIARRNATAPFDFTTRTEGLVDAFLRAWHDTTDRTPELAA
ncbi:RNase H family protein [Actinomadura geliboluensis]|uniref:RNase H family protein n=1 Tax=Actinomadura geliboluensis TaxID=882440 RepID=UPI00369C7FC3